MENLQHVIQEISEVTTTIQTKYPELYRFIDENPMTVPKTQHPHIDKNVMEDYLESLNQLLKKYLETQKSK